MLEDAKRIEKAVLQSRAWLEQIVISYQLCPFAQKPYDLGQVRFIATTTSDSSEILKLVNEACQLLSNTPSQSLETTLIILESAFPNFMDYWTFVGIVEAQLYENGYEGVFQVASFHPDYLFGGSSENDPANFTNRSPFPMLHLLRENSITAALVHHPAPESIPERNISLMQEKGEQHWMQIMRRIKEQH